MPLGVKSKCFLTSFSRAAASSELVPKSSTSNRNRLGDPDRVSNLDFATPRNPGGHEILRHEACRVGAAAIDLRRILPREGATTVTSHTAVGIDDDLSACETGVPLGPPHHEAARGVYMEERVGIRPNRPEAKPG